MEAMDKLEELLARDEIYRAYADSVRELEDRYERIAESLPPEERKVLVGYRQCRELMALRAREVLSEQMNEDNV